MWRLVRPPCSRTAHVRPPALLPATKRACGAATPIVFQVERVMTRAVAARPAATRALSKEHPSGKRNCAGDAESGQARGAYRTAWRPWDQDPDTRRLSGRAGRDTGIRVRPDFCCSPTRQDLGATGAGGEESDQPPSQGILKGAGNPS